MTTVSRGRPATADPIDGWRVAWLGDLGGHLPVEPGVLELCAAALERCAKPDGFRVEPLVPDFDFEALWQAFVTLRHATSGTALKIHYDNPRQRDLLEAGGGVGDRGRAWPDGARNPRRLARALALVQGRRSALFERYDLLALPTAQVFAFDCRDALARRNRRAQDGQLSSLDGGDGARHHGRLPGGQCAGRASTGSGRPMGMQLIGRPRADAEVLSAAADYEQALGITAGT